MVRSRSGLAVGISPSNSVFTYISLARYIGDDQLWALGVGLDFTDTLAATGEILDSEGVPYERPSASAVNSQPR